MKKEDEMRGQSKQDASGGAPASCFQDLPVEENVNRCYTVDGTKRAGDLEQRGGKICHRDTREAYKRLLEDLTLEEKLKLYELLQCLWRSQPSVEPHQE